MAGVGRSGTNLRLPIENAAAVSPAPSGRGADSGGDTGGNSFVRAPAQCEQLKQRSKCLLDCVQHLFGANLHDLKSFIYQYELIMKSFIAC